MIKTKKWLLSDFYLGLSKPLKIDMRNCFNSVYLTSSISILTLQKFTNKHNGGGFPIIRSDWLLTIIL